MNDLLKFITCGSVDDGKSTLIGHILYDAKLLFADQEEALVLDSKVGSRDGAIDYSLLLDGLMAEREQGITIDVAYRYFTTDNRSFIVADTPGHEEYTRNMAVGASFADLAIILIDATQGVLVQTKRHARICKLMGIRYFVFAVNKMDLAAYSEARFADIQKQIADLTADLQLDHVKIIPVSATAGDNVTVKSDKMPWYDGEPILTYLENVEIQKADTEQGFYMPVQRVCRPNHAFRGFQGQIEAGTVTVGDEITVLPSGERAAVKSVLVGDKESESAFLGQPVTITLDKEIDISRGCVLTKDSDIQNAKAFEATILWMDDADLSEGKEYFLKLGTKKIAGKVKEIRYKTDMNTGKQISAHTLSKNEIALCEIVLDEEIPVDLFEKHRTLGEFILIDRLSNMTSACGVVSELLETDDENCAVITGNGITAKTYLFDEFFYNEKSLTIDNYSGENKRFTIGDAIPLKGESYNYPAYFDVLAIDSAAAIEIRNGTVTDVKPLSAYQYIGLPVVNGKGFFVEIHSQADLENFFADMHKTDKQHLYEKWMKFETYRRVIFTSNYWGI
ncbi:MAG: sulfate adenylyltransferase subunit 1 [Candidatus Fimenecus sp.]